MTRKEQYLAAKIERERLVTHYETVEWRSAPTKGVDSGAFGKKRELEHTRENSLKNKVSRAGMPDNYFKFNGKAKPYECKTNGGRVGAVIASLEHGNDGFIVYEMNVCNSTTGGKPRIITPVIMHYSQFIELLKDTGALRLNSRDGEPCIQVSSKKLYERLLDYPIIFDENDEYTSDDFEGLEI